MFLFHLPFPFPLIQVRWFLVIFFLGKTVKVILKIRGNAQSVEDKRTRPTSCAASAF